MLKKAGKNFCRCAVSGLSAKSSGAGPGAGLPMARIAGRAAAVTGQRSGFLGLGACPGWSVPERVLPAPSHIPMHRLMRRPQISSAGVLTDAGGESADLRLWWTTSTR